MSKLDFQPFLIIKELFVFSLLFFVSIAGSAMDLEDMIREALKCNPELQAYYLQFEANQKKMIQVRALPEPKLTYTRFLSEVQTRTGPQERIIQLNQPFPWPGKLALRGGIANREAEVAFHQYESLQRVIIARIADAYFDYALLGESITINNRNVSYFDQLIPVVEEKVRGGGRLSDTLLLEIEKEKALDVVRGLNERRPILNSQIATELGRQTDLNETLPFPKLSRKSIPLPPVKQLEQQLESHPNVAAATSNVLSMKLKQELAQKASLPEMSLGASVIDIGNGGDTAFGVVFGVNVPIRHHKYQAEIEQAKLEKSASLRLKENTLNQLRNQLHREYQLLKDAQRRADLYRDRLVPKAEQTLAQLEEGYRGNNAGIDEIVDSEETLLKLRLEYLKAAAEAQKRAVYIRVLTEPVSKACIQAFPVTE
ncbi:MAG: TolC family protein [Verrucomicrobiales bacterium]|nr:TolC family protein [Verrucomicrobiales bacterium]